ncbi:MAG: hypothetical protein ABEK03_08655 [Candidatus Bipolaricaulia bacterium]
MTRAQGNRSERSATPEDVGHRAATSTAGKISQWIGSAVRQGMSSLWEIGKAALLYALVGAAVAGIMVLLTGASYGLGLIGVGVLAALVAILPHGSPGGGHFSGPGGHAADATVHDQVMSGRSSNPRARRMAGKMLMTAVLLIGAGVLFRMLSG